MSVTTPLPNGIPIATAEDVEALRTEVADLRRLVAELQGALADTGREEALSWREALAEAQRGFASLTDEERELYEESAREARALMDA
jgi:hypothetical protein